MTKKRAKGKCFICEKVYTKMGMTNHLKTCLKKKIENLCPEKTEEYFHLSISSVERPDFWLHVGVLTSSRLWEIDDFLREIWFYSEDHLSGFTINDIQYDSTGFDWPDEKVGMFIVKKAMRKSMDHKISEVLEAGMEFLYEYDFGTTSRVKIKVISRYEDLQNNEPIKLLARNELPKYSCEKCGKSAEVLCGEIYDLQWLCKECAKKEELLDFSIPFKNTPRVGIY